MESRKQEQEPEAPEVLEEGTTATDELDACCKAGTASARA